MSESILDPTPENLRRAAACIRSGGVVLSPSDTNMALGATNYLVPSDLRHCPSHLHFRFADYILCTQLALLGKTSVDCSERARYKTQIRQLEKPQTNNGYQTEKYPSLYGVFPASTKNKYPKSCPVSRFHHLIVGVKNLAGQRVDPID